MKMPIDIFPKLSIYACFCIYTVVNYNFDKILHESEHRFKYLGVSHILYAWHIQPFTHEYMYVCV